MAPTASVRLLSMRHCFGGSRGIGTPLQPDMLFEFGAEQLENALNEHGGTGDKRAISRPFDEAAKLHEAIEIFLCALASFNLRHQGRKIDRPHTARRTLPAAFAFEEIGKLQRLADHTGGIVHYNDAG